MMNPKHQISFDDYFWLKNEGPKRVKKRQFRSKCNIKYCSVHNCYGPHFVIQNQFSFSGRVIKLDSRKKIKKFLSRKDFVNVSSICYGYGEVADIYIFDKKKGKKQSRVDDISDCCLESKFSHVSKKKIERNKHIYRGEDYCTICIGKMKGKIVKTTPCNHTFCKKCFDFLIEYHRNNFTTFSIKCPLCRCDIFKGTSIVKNKLIDSLS